MPRNRLVYKKSAWDI